MGLFGCINMKKYFKSLKVIFLIVVFIIVGFTGYKLYQDFYAQKLVEKEVITVACVGDSLTFGRSYTEEVYVYPTFLAERLGSSYKVTNYGMGGTCVQADLNYPYVNTRAYHASVESESDILIIMLGTNDLWDTGWRDEQTFYEHYINLIDSYLKSENEPEIYLCTIPYMFVKNHEYLGTQFDDKTEMVSNVVRKIAEERGYHLIEMNEVTSKHPEWYKDDGIHFNYYGAAGVAEIIYDAIENKSCMYGK